MSSKRYVELLQNVINECEKIDKDAEWQEVEPEWWLMMNTLQRMAIDHKKALMAPRINQCDGCARNLILHSGLHINEDGLPVQACTANRYN